MKKRLLALAVLLLALPALALADPARFLAGDGDRTYHANHLMLHQGSENCRISGNYVSVRLTPGGNDILGYVEQADSIRLEEVAGTYARITVTYAAPTSTRSRVGLTGWLNADYVECTCSAEEYYGGNPRLSFSIGTVASGGANLVEVAQSDGRVMDRIPEGVQVQVLAEYGSWYRVRWDVRTGFVSTGSVNITRTGVTEGGEETVAGWQTAYQSFLRANHDYVGNVAFFDMDRDGTPELIVHNGDETMAGAACMVYSWDGASMVYAGTVGFRDCALAAAPETAYPGLFCRDGSMGVYTTVYYTLADGLISETPVLQEDHTRGGSVTWDENPMLVRYTGNAALVNLARSDALSFLQFHSYGESLAIGWDNLASE